MVVHATVHVLIGGGVVALALCISTLAMFIPWYSYRMCCWSWTIKCLSYTNRILYCTQHCFVIVFINDALYKNRTEAAFKNSLEHTDFCVLSQYWDIEASERFNRETVAVLFIGRAFPLAWIKIPGYNIFFRTKRENELMFRVNVHTYLFPQRITLTKIRDNCRRNCCTI